MLGVSFAEVSGLTIRSLNIIYIGISVFQNIGIYSSVLETQIVASLFLQLLPDIVLTNLGIQR